MAQPSSAEVLLVVIDLLAAVLDAPSRDDAALDARAMMRDVDPDLARRVAAGAAVESLWMLRHVKDDAAIRRQLERRRLEASWAAS